MSTLAVDQITDNSGGATAQINGFTPGPSNMMGRNKIINGKMEIAQRGTSFAVGTAFSGYTLDRYSCGNSSAATATFSQQTDAPTGDEFQNSLRFTVTAADTSIAAADSATIQQVIEGYNVRDLIGRTFTLSFWVRSSKTGTHCVGFTNGTPDRSYVVEYTINAANTWEKKTITLSGGLITAGTWNWTNGAGLRVYWAMAAGSTYQTTANAWQTGWFFATANQVNCLDTIGNIFAITGVQLEVGSVATPFEHRPYGAELALCQRYYVFGGTGDGNRFPSTAGNVGALAVCGANNYINVGLQFPVRMRSAPIIRTASTGGTLGTLRDYSSSVDITVTGTTVFDWGIYAFNATITPTKVIQFQYDASAEL